MVLVLYGKTFPDWVAAHCHHPSTAVARSGVARSAPAGTRTAPAAKSTRRKRAKSIKRRRARSTNGTAAAAVAAETGATGSGSAADHDPWTAGPEAVPAAGSWPVLLC